jgi:hypothetical protein
VTSRNRKQLVVLAALVATFVAAMWVIPRGQGPAGARGGPSNPTGRPGQAAATPEVVDVRIELLQDERSAPAEPTRNLFAFRQRVQPPPTRGEVEEPPPQVVTPPQPTGPPPPPPILLKFIGVLETPGQGKVAILSDGRGNTFHAREGDTVDGRYKVLKIGTESVELAYVDGRGRQTLRLSGQ